MSKPISVFEQNGSKSVFDYFETQIKPCIKRVIKRSKEYYTLLDDALQNRSNLVAEVIEGYFVFWRRALTRFSYYNTSTMSANHQRSFNYKMIKSYLEDMQGKDTQDIIKDILLQKLIDLHKLDITDMVILETMPSNTLLIALIIN